MRMQKWADGFGRDSRRALLRNAWQCGSTALHILIATALTMAATPLAAGAQGRWHVDIGAGAFIPISDVKFVEDSIPYDLDFDVGGAFTAGGGYALDQWIDFTAQFHTA